MFIVFHLNKSKKYLLYNSVISDSKLFVFSFSTLIVSNSNKEVFPVLLVSNKSVGDIFKALDIVI